MRRSHLIIISLLVIFLGVSQSIFPKDTDRNVGGVPKLKVRLFYVPTCKACLRLKKEYIPYIEKRYGKYIEIEKINIFEDKEGLELLISLDPQGTVPSILVGNNFLKGSSEIKKYLGIIIEQFIKERKIAPFLLPKKTSLIKNFENLSIFTVIIAGLGDGINPCAFAVIIFLISFLSVYGYGKKETIIVGSLYSLGVFLAYLSIGLGFYKILSLLGFYYSVIKSFYLITAIFCFVFAFVSLLDFLKVTKGNHNEGMYLKLSSSLKKRISLTIGTHLRRREKHNYIALGAITFLVGIVVAFFEAPCTGQVYAPTIMYIMKIPRLRINAFFYLFLYNIMFIAPLLLIFFVALLGVRSERINNFFKRHLALLKLMMVFLFLFLGIFILIYS